MNSPVITITVPLILTIFIAVWLQNAAYSSAFGQLGKRIEDQNAAYNSSLDQLGKRIEDLGKRLDDLGKRLDDLRTDLGQRMNRIDDRLDTAPVSTNDYTPLPRTWSSCTANRKN